MEIRIRKAILHILDTNATMPVYSQREIDLTEDVVNNFIAAHIKKLFEDTSVRIGSFKNNSPILKLVKNINNSFMESSIKIADLLYEIMKKNVDIPGADLLVSLVDIDSLPYLVIVKFNYKEGYTHYVDYCESGTSNKIIVHKVIFASENQKNDEATAINLNDYSIRTLEKEFNIDGEKKLYFSQMFLCCKTDLSQRESVKVINDVAKEISKKYYNDSFEKISAIKEAIYDNVEVEGNIDVEHIAETTFPDSPQIQKEYIEKVKEAGVYKKVEFTGENPEKKFNKHKIKIDNGIEISIPIEIYRNKDIIEFINNSDGTVSIVIKKINKIINK